MRVGKTFSNYSQILKKTLIGNVKIAITSYSYQSLKREHNYMMELIDRSNLREHFKIHLHPLEIVVKHNGSRIVFVDRTRPEHMKPLKADYIY